MAQIVDIFTHLYEGAVHASKNSFNQGVQQGVFSARSQCHEVLLPIDERSFLLNQWLPVVDKILHRKILTWRRFV
jgi:hypothetical protein